MDQKEPLPPSSSSSTSTASSTTEPTVPPREGEDEGSDRDARDSDDSSGSDDGEGPSPSAEDEARFLSPGLPPLSRTATVPAGMPGGAGEPAATALQSSFTNAFVIEKLTLFEAATRYYIAGGNKRRDMYRVLEVDRTCPGELRVMQHDKTYSFLECQRLIFAKAQQHGRRGGDEVVRRFKFCGILGFVKFHRQHYMLLCTRKRKLGFVGGHFVYGIDETALLKVTHDAFIDQTKTAQLYAKYVQMFEAVDLTKDFYFSYRYDLTHSLQSNMAHYRDSLAAQAAASGTGPAPPPPRPQAYNEHFLWNFFIVQGFLEAMPGGSHWLVPVVHGFFRQKRLRLGSSSLTLTLLARRSRHHAGTRFLKRGISPAGHVANEVETEQILHNEHSWVHGQGGLSSFVMMRGSIPLFWSQPNPLAPKPDIVVRPDQRPDVTRRHLERLGRRYGSPVHVFNLIKKVESRPKEAPLGAAFRAALARAEADGEEEHRHRLEEWRRAADAGGRASPAPAEPVAVRYADYDFLNEKKRAGVKVTAEVARLAEPMIDEVGIFSQQRMPASGFNIEWRNQATEQRGVIRVNCLADDHEILTSRGFLGCEALARAHTDDPRLLVAAYDAAARRIVYERAERVIVNAPRAQPMVEFADGGGGGVSLLVTPEHDMFVASASPGGGGGGGGGCFGKRAAGELAALAAMPSPPELVMMDAAEGGAGPAALGSGVSAERLRAFGRWAAGDSGAAGFSGAALPEWVRLAGRDGAALALDGAASPALVPSAERADALSALLLHAGLSPRVRRVPARGRQGAAEWWEVEWVTAAKEGPRRRRRRRPRFVGPSAVRAPATPYAGRTWCVTVPSGLIWARRRACGGAPSRPVVVGNCIDCLDRTNVAQYCIGREALRRQLAALGVPASMVRAMFPELCAVLQEMYADHGDRIAKQYGGSGAMHKEALKEQEDAASSKKNKKKSLAQNAITSIRRYYNNNFNDADKQNAINVFLGNFMPERQHRHIWDMAKEDIEFAEDADDVYSRHYRRFQAPFEAPLFNRQQAAAAERRRAQQMQLQRTMSDGRLSMTSTPLPGDGGAAPSSSSSSTLESAATEPPPESPPQPPQRRMERSLSRIWSHHRRKSVIRADLSAQRQRFQQYMEEHYDPLKLSSFDVELRREYNKTVVLSETSAPALTVPVRGGGFETLDPDEAIAGAAGSGPSTPVAGPAAGGGLPPPPLLSPARAASPRLPASPARPDDDDAATAEAAEEEKGDDADERAAFDAYVRLEPVAAWPRTKAAESEALRRDLDELRATMLARVERLERALKARRG